MILMRTLFSPIFQQHFAEQLYCFLLKIVYQNLWFLQFSIPEQVHDSLDPLAYYLKQNLLQFLFLPKYTDTRHTFQVGGGFSFNWIYWKLLTYNNVSVQAANFTNNVFCHCRTTRNLRAPHAESTNPTSICTIKALLLAIRGSHAWLLLSSTKMATLLAIKIHIGVSPCVKLKH